MKSTTEAAVPMRHNKKIKISCVHHAGAASVAATATLPSATVITSRACAATPIGLAMPTGALSKSGRMGGHTGEERNGEEQSKERTMTYETLRLQANTSSIKRRAPRTDLSKLTAEEQERWKKAQARQYSASARPRQVVREQDLRDKVQTLSIFQVLVEATPDAVLLLSPDGRARILFVNDQGSQLLRPASSGVKEEALIGRSLLEWMDAQGKAAFVAAIGICIFCKDVTRRVQCILHSPCSPLVQQLGGQMQYYERQELEHHQEQQLQKQETNRADLTLRLTERGLVVFMRPDKTRGKGV
jgi:PAS domain-containing protein